MRKWLRSRFAWRFSLARLVVAVVFLGMCIGLNMREIGPVLASFSGGLPARYWGWPLPFDGEVDEGAYELVYRINRQHMEELNLRSFDDDWAIEVADGQGAFDSARHYRFPITHQAYRLLNWDSQQEFHAVYVPVFHNRRTFICYGIVDALFALAVLSFILCLQIPRRKPEPEGAK